MINLIDTKLFKLMHDSTASKKELHKELQCFIDDLTSCYSSKNELCKAWKECQKAFVMLNLLESTIKASTPCKRWKEHRFHFITSLKLHLKLEMKAIKYLLENDEYIVSKQIQGKYQWTGKKTDLIELAYALQENATVNHGNIQLEKFIEDFGAFFGVNITNSSRMFFNIKQRKTESRTTFLDTLAKMLNKRMIKDDEK